VVEEFKAQLKPGQGGTRKGGEVRLVLPVGAREVELVLAGRFDVSPAQAGQLSTVPGVLEVVEI
jgi:DNA polymerase-3 subunit alpha